VNTGPSKYPLCKGGCGHRLVDEPRLAQGRRRLNVRDGLCAICLEQRMSFRERGSLLEAPAPTTGEIRVVKMLRQRIPDPEERQLVASVLGLEP
jgi:hypothetical protein